MITTVENVENYLLITVDEDFRDEVEGFITAVEKYIERYTGRSFSVSASSARYFDGSGSGELWIGDAATVTEVKIYDEILTTDQYHLYPLNTSPKTRIILPYRIFPEDANNVKVTGTWGYGAAVPADIEFAATLLVADIVNAANNEGSGEVASETIGRYSVSYATGQTSSNTTPEALNAHKILKLYRKLI